MKTINYEPAKITKFTVYQQRDMLQGFDIRFDPQENDHDPGFDFEVDNAIFETLDNDRELTKNGGSYYGYSHNWFCAKIEVLYKGFSASNYLSGCSYSSYENFIDSDGYYPEMVQNCIDQINAEIEARNAEIRRNLELRKALIFAGKYPELMPNMKRPVCIQ